MDREGVSVKYEGLGYCSGMKPTENSLRASERGLGE